MSATIEYTVGSLDYAPKVGERYSHSPYRNLKCLAVERDRKSGRVYITAEIEKNTKGAK